jgi:hypothetical protein
MCVGRQAARRREKACVPDNPNSIVVVSAVSSTHAIGRIVPVSGKEEAGQDLHGKRKNKGRLETLDAS